MKNKIFKIGISLSLLAFIGCGKDYLEKLPSGDKITGEQIKKASELLPKLQASNVAGIYSMMYTRGTGGGVNRNDDFGQKGYDIFSDMLSADMPLLNSVYGWYTGISKLTSTVDYTNLDNYMVWRYYYRIINASNQVIDALGGNDNVPKTEEAKFYMGQAKAMRAYGYFYLMNFFVRDYKPSKEVLPIYDNTQVPNQPLSKAEDVLNLIEKDLKDAITLLDNFNRTGKEQVNKYVAKALLAYTYAYMGNNEKVITLTSDIIDNGGFTIVSKEEIAFSGDSSIGGFRDVNTSGWMWGTDITVQSDLNLVSWWGQMDIFTYSYPAFGETKGIDAGLYERIRDKDVRKKQFGPPQSSSNAYVPYNKFYPEIRVRAKQRSIETDYVYMRVAEMYLLKAEALAKLDRDAEAIAVLKVLLKERMEDEDSYAYVDTLSGDALDEEIYLQTRIELWGEGKSYLAMKRNKATITRGNNHAFLSGRSYEYDAPELTFEIPQSEIQNNPYLTK